MVWFLLVFITVGDSTTLKTTSFGGASDAYIQCQASASLARATIKGLISTACLHVQTADNTDHD